MDGASSFGVLVRVLLPQARPALLTLCALVFTYTWNEFLLALVLVSGAPSKQTAPLGLSFFAGAVARRRPDQGRGGVGARRRADRDRVHLPPAALHPRHARGSGKGVGSGPDQAGVHRRRLDPRRRHDGLVHPQQRRGLRRLGGRAGRPRPRPARADPHAGREDGARPRRRPHDHAPPPTAGPRSATATRCCRRSAPAASGARAKDERIPLNHGVIGQETQGPGGFFMALRAIAVIKDICAEMEEVCPDAWLFNYTNPVNLVAEAVTHHSQIKMRLALRGADLLRRPDGAGTPSSTPRSSSAHDGRAEPRLLERRAHLRRRGRHPAHRGGLGAAPRRPRALDDGPAPPAPGGHDGVDPGGVLHVLLLPRRDAWPSCGQADHPRRGHHGLGARLLAPLRGAGRDRRPAARPGPLARRHQRARACDRRDGRDLQRQGRGAPGQRPERAAARCRLPGGPRRRDPRALQPGGHRAARAAPLPRTCRGLVEMLGEYQALAAEAAWSGGRRDAVRALAANPLVMRLDLAEQLYDELWPRTGTCSRTASRPRRWRGCSSAPTAATPRRSPSSPRATARSSGAGRAGSSDLYNAVSVERRDRRDRRSRRRPRLPRPARRPPTSKRRASAWRAPTGPRTSSS